MAQKEWYVHIDGEILGPLSERLTGLMLSHHCLRFADYAWSQGMTQWARISELANFSKLMPPYPKVGIPKILNQIGSPPTKENANQKAPNVPRSKENSAIAPLKPREERATIGARVSFGGEVTYPVVNISESGLLLAASDEVVHIGTEIHFTLIAPVLGAALSMTGVLVREKPVDGKNTVGIEFTLLNPVHLRLIKAYVQSREDKKNAA